MTGPIRFPEYVGFFPLVFISLSFCKSTVNRAGYTVGIKGKGFGRKRILGIKRTYLNMIFMNIDI